MAQIKFNKYDYIDYWDHDELEKLQEKRSYQWIKLFKKVHDAKEKDDEKALAKAIEALRKHEAQDKVIKAKANKSGYFWP